MQTFPFRSVPKREGENIIGIAVRKNHYMSKRKKSNPVSLAILFPKRLHCSKQAPVLTYTKKYHTVGLP